MLRPRSPCNKKFLSYFAMQYSVTQFLLLQRNNSIPSNLVSSFILKVPVVICQQDLVVVSK